MHQNIPKRLQDIFRIVKTLLTIELLIWSFHLHAQDNTNTLISLNVRNIPLNNVLAIIEQQIPYKFAYATDLLTKQKNVTLVASQKTLNELFLLLFKGTNISYSIIDNQIVLSEISVPSQVTISGYVKDNRSGESLPGAIIYFPGKQTGICANNYGFYSFTQNTTDSLEVLVSFVGFNKISQKIFVRQNSLLNFYLTDSKFQLNPLIVNNSQPDDNIKKNVPGKTEVSMNMVKTAPSINGNGDIMNTIEMMPGVIAGLDGRPGYFIRGGNTDQNLVQLDEATLYNPNHLLGLVSIFNSSAIKSAYLLKAGFPASFGDHLSSVLDLTLKDGNNQQFEGDIEAGTISSGITLSGPIVKDKAAFFVSSRRSTIDLLLKPMDFKNYYSNYNFYDINAKLNIWISKRDRIYLSLYQGKDNSAYTKDSTAKKSINYKVSYGNQALSLRLNHLFSSKLFFNTSVIYNNYYHDVTSGLGRYYAELYSGIRDIDVKADVYFYPNINHTITAGADYLYQTLYPATVADKNITTETTISIRPSDIPEKHTRRLAAYFSDEIKLSPSFSAYIGGRAPLFFSKDASYLGFEPRLSLMHLLNPTTSIKFSYTQMHQYLHMVQSYNASVPAEIWIGSSKAIQPQNCKEASLGLFKNLKENIFQSSIEVYYKHMGNQLLFKGGLTPAIKSDLDSSVIFGQGQSYGAELYIAKNKGKLTGWLAYTLSYSYQQFDSLNLGRQFPFANDRRHSLYLSGRYELNRHWDFSSSFLLTSGSAFTLFKDASSKPYDPLYYNNVTGNEYDNNPNDNKVQNNYRLAPYNRLDISIRYRKTRNFPNRVVESEWVFSVYNVYGRKNTFFAYCSIDPVTRKPEAVEVSFVPVIPSISYNLKF
jgi:hypothetical protein